MQVNWMTRATTCPPASPLQQQPCPEPILPCLRSADPVINDAIDAYKAALEHDPSNAQAWAELARIQAYSSQMLRNDTERLGRMKESLQSADNAQELAPDDSTIRAIRAFVLRLVCL